ncbi:MAG: acyl-CoA thioesterase [Oscillospiraceae bacterium]|nr:acyl-CoA thioesterase [Oscillospiraceae bacterium]MCL2278049.1 acyl-CoA thioesterase [Oscillospiraceae bacterium]
MYLYSRPVFYYETDKMGVVHHSNYFRWLEEARTCFFDDNDLAYVVTESLGVMSPITDVSVKYKFPAKFGDIFTVKLCMTKYTGVRFRVEYVVVNQNDDILLEGESGHAFIDERLKPVSLVKTIPERHERMNTLLNKHLRSSL